MGLFSDRMGIEATYWNRVVDDALVAQQFPVTGGFRATQLVNIGQIEAQGVEISVNALVYNSQDFSVNLFANGSYLWERVTDMGGAAPIKAGGAYSRVRNFVIEDYAPGGHFGAQLITCRMAFYLLTITVMVLQIVKPNWSLSWGGLPWMTPRCQEPRT